MNKLIFVLVFVCINIKTGFSQTYQANVLPGLKGNELLTALVGEYKTSTVLAYNNARDTLFSKVEAIGDSLECVYTGMRLYLTPGADPTEAVYLNGIANGINTEHAWPQAKGANGQAQSDMHHLYPSKIKANSDRGDNPLGEIPDNETKTWYYRNTERTTIPTIGRDLYAESKTGKFEPRESVKGNLARSLFYFYTMYKDQADALDAGFFNKMKADLCEWHNLDPVDEREWNRNQKVSFYQGGKLNPFILDCSLVSRAYCNNIDQYCEHLVSLFSKTEQVDVSLITDIYPNPGHGIFNILLLSEVNTLYEIMISDTNGRILSNQKIYKDSDRLIVENIFTDFIPGIYIINILDTHSGHIETHKYIKL